MSKQENPQKLELTSKIEQTQNNIEAQEEIILQAKQIYEEASIAFSVENESIEKKIRRSQPILFHL